jgi:hypothetical protein
MAKERKYDAMNPSTPEGVTQGTSTLRMNMKGKNRNIGTTIWPIHKMWTLFSLVLGPMLALYNVGTLCKYRKYYFTFRN